MPIISMMKNQQKKRKRKHPRRKKKKTEAIETRLVTSETFKKEED